MTGATWSIKLLYDSTRDSVLNFANSQRIYITGIIVFVYLLVSVDFKF